MGLLSFVKSDSSEPFATNTHGHKISQCNRTLLNLFSFLLMLISSKPFRTGLAEWIYGRVKTEVVLLWHLTHRVSSSSNLILTFKYHKLLGCMRIRVDAFAYSGWYWLEVIFRTWSQTRKVSDFQKYSRPKNTIL